jgi:hypothetical protein
MAPEYAHVQDLSLQVQFLQSVVDRRVGGTGPQMCIAHVICEECNLSDKEIRAWGSVSIESTGSVPARVMHEQS